MTKTLRGANQNGRKLRTRLTDRDYELIELIKAGYSITYIADRWGILTTSVRQRISDVERILRRRIYVDRDSVPRRTSAGIERAHRDRAMRVGKLFYRNGRNTNEIARILSMRESEVWGLLDIARQVINGEFDEEVAA